VEHDFRRVKVAQLDSLPGNPQVLTGDAKYALIRSIARDGFVEPVLVRPVGKRYLVVSGNHRIEAARDLGLVDVPAVVADLTDEQVTRLAVELNTIKGTPDTDLLLRFLDGFDTAALFLGDLELPADLVLDQDVLADDVETEGPDEVDLDQALLGHVLVTVELERLDEVVEGITAVVGLAQVRVSRGA